MKQIKLFSILFISLIFTNCKKEKVQEPSAPLPSIGAVNAVDIDYTSAKVTGKVDIKDASAIIVEGICYGTHSKPTVNDNKATTNKNSFTIELDDLTVGTKYYARTFVTTQTDTYYSDEVSFSTRTLAGTTWDFFIIHDAATNWHADVTFNMDGTTVYDEPAFPGTYLSHGTWSINKNVLTYTLDASKPNTYVFTGTFTTAGMGGTYLYGTEHQWSAVLK